MFGSIWSDAAECEPGQFVSQAHHPRREPRTELACLFIKRGVEYSVISRRNISGANNCIQHRQFAGLRREWSHS